MGTGKGPGPGRKREEERRRRSWAAATSGWISKPTTAYTSPSNQSIPVAFLSPGDAVQPLCFTEGQQLRMSNLWFRIAKGAMVGFVHRDTIGGISGDVRHC